MPKNPDYKHYVNPKDLGITVFLTSTVLDFVHALRRDEMKDWMVNQIYQECRVAHATLHAYVVMVNHVHLLLTLRPTMTCSEFMQAYKSNSSREIAPFLTEDEHEAFGLQRGLNRRPFWKASFKGYHATVQKTFVQKRNYIHMNPVRAKLVEYPWDYQWSSAKMLRDGKWNPTEGLKRDED